MVLASQLGTGVSCQQAGDHLGRWENGERWNLGRAGGAPRMGTGEPHTKFYQKLRGQTKVVGVSRTESIR